jgi:hypothetical protein
MNRYTGDITCAQLSPAKLLNMRAKPAAATHRGHPARAAREVG